MKTTRNLKKNKKIIYTALGTIALGVIGVFGMSLNNTKLENIVVVKLCADEMYNYFLMDKQINNIEDYLPKPI